MRRVTVVLPFLLLGALAACAELDREQVISDRGGVQVLLVNGVCVEVDDTNDDRTQLTRIAPHRCETGT